jgi:hypothetical protein
MEARSMASAAARTSSGDVRDRDIEADLYDGGGVAMASEIESPLTLNQTEKDFTAGDLRYRQKFNEEVGK